MDCQRGIKVRSKSSLVLSKQDEIEPRSNESEGGLVDISHVRTDPQTRLRTHGEKLVLGGKKWRPHFWYEWTYVLLTPSTNVDGSFSIIINSYVIPLVHAFKCKIEQKRSLSIIIGTLQVPEGHKVHIHTL